MTRLEIEVGPGRGGFLLERLPQHPDLAMIGFEISRKWTTLVNDRLEREGLARRGHVFSDDVRLALPKLEPSGFVSAVYFHFPDPWWKKRHQKRLVVGSDVLDHVARILAPQADLYVQTDVEERAKQYETQILGHAAFEPNGDPGPTPSARMVENPYGARSHREHRAIADAIPVYRMRFRKRADYKPR